MKIKAEAQRSVSFFLGKLTGNACKLTYKTTLRNLIREKVVSETTTLFLDTYSIALLYNVSLTRKCLKSLFSIAFLTPSETSLVTWRYCMPTLPQDLQWETEHRDKVGGIPTLEDFTGSEEGSQGAITIG